MTRAQEQLNDVLNTKANKEYGPWLNDHHWNLYLIPSFAQPVSEAFAKRAGETFVATFGPKAYAAMAIGRGKDGHVNLHILLGGVWHGKARKYRAAAIAQATSLWRHGQMQKVEPYDHTRKASGYLPDHHDIEWAGATPRRHYV